MQTVETVEYYARVIVPGTGEEITMGPSDRSTANRRACQYKGYVEMHTVTRTIHVSKKKS